ncbi:MAG: tRNA (N(6)-L-threonylcarbamoyladenosine(37)-C(2))-methylthiotransferase MtaB [Brumimicrobium sp.]|nr:tRNA (N(6)-L-threonylcarbamoyladenosine(37)-C(2))-methylthiotransferase MtaB [Brumimicrobium sp.]
MIQYKRVAFYTLGCKLNFAETSTIARSFEDAGYAKVDFNDSPDIYVINTCSVTDNADKKCRQIARKAKQINPESFLIMIGCYAQLKPEEIAKMFGVNMVLGANEKFDVVKHFEQAQNGTEKTVEYGKIKAVKEFIPSFSYGDRTRSFLKIQDGCDYFCTFCTIPLARGKSRNASIAETIIEAKRIASTNVKEVVLTGVNIGDFGQGGDENFYGLIKELDKVEGIERYRISSIEPNLLTNEIIDFCLVESSHFAPHFHIPLQSGSDELLKKMRRRYLRATFTNRVEEIKRVSPNACIGVDVIVGFPGETEEHFMETYNYLRDLDISYLHVFTYSERAQTTANKMEGVVPMDVRKERSKRLHILSDKKRRAFYESQIGKTGTVLWEAENHNGFLHGFTENYIRVKRPYDISQENQLQTVKYLKIDEDGVVSVEVMEDAFSLLSKLLN